jgi:hypothetical protein
LNTSSSSITSRPFTSPASGKPDRATVSTSSTLLFLCHSHVHRIFDQRSQSLSTNERMISMQLETTHAKSAFTISLPERHPVRSATLVPTGRPRCARISSASSFGWRQRAASEPAPAGPHGSPAARVRACWTSPACAIRFSSRRHPEFPFSGMKNFRLITFRPPQPARDRAPVERPAWLDKAS